VYNITNAPFGILRNLAHSSIDSFSTLAKIFVIQRSSKKNKVNEYLLPFSMKVFNNLIVDARRDVLKLMENAVGLRTLLREQNMVIPKKMNLAMLTALVQEVDVYFSNFQKEMLAEANRLTISRYAGSSSRVRTEKLAHFEGLLRTCCMKVVCWLKYESAKTQEYSVSLLQDIVFRFMENLKTYFESLFPYYQTNEAITSCMLCVSSFFETVVNLGFEYLLVDVVNAKRGVANLEWLMLQIYNVNNYHQILGIHEQPEEEEKLLEFRINKLADLDERSTELLKFIQNSGCLVKYTSCRIAQSSHSFLRILMTLIDLDDPKYNELLEATRFVNFFSLLIQKQYAVLQMFIRTKTESIHVISRYVEESNLRLRIFEGLLKSSSRVFKQDLLETQTVQRIVNTLLPAKAELDVSFYRSNYKFLVFRNFLPFRAEAMSFVSLIFWNKKANERIYNEFVNELVKANSLRAELENLRQKKNRLLKLSSFTFFSRLLQAADRHVNYLLREQGIYDAMLKEFEDDRELVPLFRETHKTLTDMESLF
jgi:hypothetical protein